MTCPRRSGQKRWVVALRSSRPVGKMLHGHALQKVRDANQDSIVALARCHVPAKELSGWSLDERCDGVQGAYHDYRNQYAFGPEQKRCFVSSAPAR